MSNALTRRRFLTQALIMAGGLEVGGMVGLGFDSPRAQDLRFLTIGTGRSSSSSFYVGGLIATCLSNPPGSRPCDKNGLCGIPNVIAIVKSTGGAIACIEGLANGRIDLAIAPADLLSRAHGAKTVTDGLVPAPHLRAIGALYTETLHLVARPEANIHTLKDLRRKRVSLGDVDLGVRASLAALLKALGLNKSTMTISDDPPGVSIDRLVDGSLDAVFFYGAVPSPLLTSRVTAGNLVIVPVDGPEVAKFLSARPLLKAGKVEAGSYGNDRDIPSFQTRFVLATTESMPDDFAELVTEALWQPSHIALYLKGLPQKGAFDLHRATEDCGIPFHPGAQAFYDRVFVTPVPDASPLPAPL